MLVLQLLQHDGESGAPLVDHLQIRYSLLSSCALDLIILIINQQTKRAELIDLSLMSKVVLNHSPSVHATQPQLISKALELLLALLLHLHHSLLRFIEQPSHSPELNPAEHIWDAIREDDFHNEAFRSLDELQERLCLALNKLHDNPDRLRSLTNFPYLQCDSFLNGDHPKIPI